MQKETPTEWNERFTPEKVRGTKPHKHKTKTNRLNNTFYNTFYQLRHVYKESQDLNNGELHFGKIRVWKWKSVPLNENRNLEQFGHWIVRVPTRSNVQQDWEEQNM